VSSARLDGEATASELAAADDHLAGCGPCRSTWDRMTRVTRLVRLHVAVACPDFSRVLEVTDVTRGRTGTACGCAASRGCGCQGGGRCRCGSRVA